MLGDGFDERRIAVSDVDLAVTIGGKGPPLLLLHGFPETRRMWHAVAPALAQRFTLICPDLRGYGDSGKPASAPDHASYSKRAMARDIVELMEALGHARFLLAAHDRGARVAQRLALDHPDRVERLCLMDIVPSSVFYERVDHRTATAYWHWFFLIQPAPLPETLLAGDPDYLVRAFLRAGWRNGVPGPEPVLADYIRAFRSPVTIRAMCEDYRAGATIDCAHEVEDRAAGRKIACPMLLLWSEHGLVGRAFDPLAVWRDWCDLVEGHALDCGHFIPEERPAETAALLLDFMSR